MSSAVQAAELMDALEARGARFGLHGDRLALDAPRGVLTPAVRAAVTAHKGAIERLVRAASGLRSPPVPRAQSRPDRRCHTCHTRRWWQRPDGGWVCEVCHPPA